MKYYHIMNQPLYIITGILLIALAWVQPVMAQQSMSRQDSLFKSKVSEFRNMQQVEDREQLYLELRKEFPMDNSEQIRRDYNYLHAALATAWLSEGNMEKFQQYREKMEEPALLYFLVNDELEAMAEEGKNLDVAVQVAQSFLDSLAIERANKSEGYSSLMHGMLLHSSALVQFKLGYYENALKNIAQADEQLERKSPGFYHKYAQILSANGKHQQAMDILGSAIEQGISDEETNRLLKNLYVEVHGSLNGYERHKASLDDTAFRQAYEKAKPKRLEPEPAPEWSLTGLDGESVSLAGLKGKVIVMDFWATWCGPCKASFPGMQKAVDAYAEDPDVKFVFVSVGEEKSVVQNYIEESGYRFHVVLDQDKQVTKDYGVRGIPAKIIIGPKGRIQFNSVGYDGSADAVYNSIKAMVEVAREAGDS